MMVLRSLILGVGLLLLGTSPVMATEPDDTAQTEVRCREDASSSSRVRTDRNCATVAKPSKEEVRTAAAKARPCRIAPVTGSRARVRKCVTTKAGRDAVADAEGMEPNTAVVPLPGARIDR